MSTALKLFPQGFVVDRLNRVPESGLISIIEASWKHWHGLGYTDDPSPAEWREYLRQENRELPRLNFVITFQGHAVAMASIVEMDFPVIQDYGPWLTNLFILPEYRGKGLSRILRAHRLAALQQLGFKKVYILAAPGTEKLHSQSGFTMFVKSRAIMRKNL